jgi:DNA gyrase subunit A
VVSQLRVMGRATQGVRLINLKGNDAIASVAKIEHEDDAEINEDAIVANPEAEEIAATDVEEADDTVDEVEGEDQEDEEAEDDNEEETE